MIYIKTFEASLSNRQRNKTLYKNADFSIDIASNNSFNFNSRMRSVGAIISMADLVKDNSKYLNDPELRNIELREKDIVETTTQLANSITKYLDNIKKYRSSNINHFLNEFDSEDNLTWTHNIPEKVYMDLVIKYHPIIADAIYTSETLGDVIDNFKVIYKDINEELKFNTITNKYNL